MPSTDAAAVTELAAVASRTLRVAERMAAAGTVEPIPVETIQQLLAAAVRLYADRARRGPALTPVVGEALTATEAMVATVAMLRVIEIDLFDFILWSGRA